MSIPRYVQAAIDHDDDEQAHTSLALAEHVDRARRDSASRAWVPEREPGEPDDDYDRRWASAQAAEWAAGRLTAGGSWGLRHGSDGWDPWKLVRG